MGLGVLSVIMCHWWLFVWICLCCVSMFLIELYCFCRPEFWQIVLLNYTPYHIKDKKLINAHDGMTDRWLILNTSIYALPVRAKEGRTSLWFWWVRTERRLSALLFQRALLCVSFYSRWASHDTWCAVRRGFVLCDRWWKTLHATQRIRGGVERACMDS